MSGTGMVGAESVMANIHETLREARSLYAEAIKLQETVIASHQEVKDSVARLETWEKAVKSSISQIKDLNWWLKNLTRGGLIMIFVLCIIGGLVGGALVLLAVRFAGGE